MKAEEIINDPHVKEFLSSRTLRKSTQKHYQLRIKNYCIFLNKTPTELIEEAEQEEDERLRMKRRKIKQYLNDYHHKLINENKSPNYIKANIVTIRSFYSEFEIELPRSRVNPKNTKKFVTTDDIVGKEHILKVLEHCNIKYKAIILLMSSSGMGRSEIIHLTYQDFLNSISEYYKPDKNELFNIYNMAEKLQDDLPEIILTWQIRRYKTKMPFVTFSSPESFQAMILYFIDRIKQNKAITSLNDYIFESKGHMIPENTLTTYFKNKNDKCDFGFRGHHRFFTSHKLRKYFASTLNKNDVPEISTHWMLGHSIDRVTDAYFKLDINALKDQYKRVVEDLSIEKVVIKEITTKEYETIIQKMHEQDEEHQKELDGVKHDVEILRKLVNVDNEIGEQRERIRD